MQIEWILWIVAMLLALGLIVVLNLRIRRREDVKKRLSKKLYEFLACKKAKEMMPGCYPDFDEVHGEVNVREDDGGQICASIIVEMDEQPPVYALQVVGRSWDRFKSDDRDCLTAIHKKLVEVLSDLDDGPFAA